MGRASPRSLKDRASTPSGSRGGGSASERARDEIVQELLDMALETGELPWERPWVMAGLPRNAISEKEYRGLNIFWLQLLAEQKGYSSTRWLTYKQAKEESFQQWRKKKNLPDNPETRKQYAKDPDGYRGVRKGEKGSSVIFFKNVPKDEDDDDDDRPRRVRRSYRVWNAEQTDLEFPPEDVEERTEIERIESAEKITEGFTDAPRIEHGGNRACYIPSQDLIQMPPRERFRSDADYYHVLFHEMIHATGSASRTNRARGDWSGMGSENYAEEELVAEIGAALLSARAGLESEEARMRNSGAYLQGWLSRLQKDPDLFLRAATKAQTAVDYILGTEFEDTQN